MLNITNNNFPFGILILLTICTSESGRIQSCESNHHDLEYISINWYRLTDIIMFPKRCIQEAMSPAGTPY